MRIVGLKFYRLRSKWGDPWSEDERSIRDMLRYDLAFRNVNDKTLIAYPKFSGGLGGRATEERWKSWGLQLEMTEGTSGMLKNTDEWETFRHPRNEDGATDYSRLEAVSLTAFIEAKNTRDL